MLLRSLGESSYEIDVRPADNAVTILSVFLSVCCNSKQLLCKLLLNGKFVAFIKSVLLILKSTLSFLTVLLCYKVLQV